MENVVLREKFDRYKPGELRREFVDAVLAASDLIDVSSLELPTLVLCRDPRDNKSLELALAGNADFLITGDADLLVLHPFQATAILTPADYLAR